MAQHRTTEQQLAAAEERLSKLRKRQRTEDTRRRVLVGAFYLGRAERDPAAHTRLMRDLDEWLTDERDRRLFRLGAIRGLYAATLTPVEKSAGWIFGKSLARRRFTAANLDHMNNWDDVLN